MLVLSRKKDEVITIGDDIRIVVVEIRGNKVRLGIEAPKEVPVHRSEVLVAIRRNREADGAKPKDADAAETTQTNLSATGNPITSNPTPPSQSEVKVQGSDSANTESQGDCGCYLELLPLEELQEIDFPPAGDSQGQS